MKLDKGIRVVGRLDELPPDTPIDAIVHLAGARVLGPPWTTARRRTLLASRTGVTDGLIELIRRVRQPPQVLVAASAVGFYGASPGASFEPRDEAGPPQPGQFQSDLCAAIEHAACRAEGLGIRVARMRFGVVLGRDGGASHAGRCCSPRPGRGAGFGPTARALDSHRRRRRPVALRACPRDVAGALNAVAPDTRSQADFVGALARSFGRRVRLRFPAAPRRFVMGEMGDLLLEGQKPTIRTE